MHLGATKSQRPSQRADLRYLRGQRRAEPKYHSCSGGVEPRLHPSQRTPNPSRKLGRGRAVRMAQVAGKQQKSDFGEVPPKPSPGGKPEVSTTAGTDSLACSWFPHLPASYFLSLAPRANFLLVWPDPVRGEARKSPRGHRASASGRSWGGAGAGVRQHGPRPSAAPSVTSRGAGIRPAASGESYRRSDLKPLPREGMRGSRSFWRGLWGGREVAMHQPLLPFRLCPPSSYPTPCRNAGTWGRAGTEHM